MNKPDLSATGYPVPVSYTHLDVYKRQGPYFKFNESVSFVINCKDQAEVDYYWNELTLTGGEEGSCGWCKDKFGLSWQVVPVEYFDLINSEDPAVREKAMKNTFKQKKIILSELK